MCGRYQLMDENGEKRDVFPSEEVTVLTAQGPQQMRWGFSLPGGGKRLLINARAESADQKMTFSPLLRASRCIVPAATFYEWDGEKHPHIFGLAGENTLYMAGLYRTEPDGGKRFVILTRAADRTVAPVHPRMPCLLPSGEYRHLWLHSDVLAPSLLGVEQQEVAEK